MIEHHRRHISKHFTTRNRYRYAHARRDPKYQTAKRRKFGHVTDLVYTGQNRDRLANVRPNVRIGGAATGGKKAISASYELVMDFPGGKGGNRRSSGAAGVSAAEMLRELVRWADEEARWAVEFCHKVYWRLIAEYKRRRKRRRFGKRKR